MDIWAISSFLAVMNVDLQVFEHLILIILEIYWLVEMLNNLLVWLLLVN